MSTVTYVIIRTRHGITTQILNKYRWNIQCRPYYNNKPYNTRNISKQWQGCADRARESCVASVLTQAGLADGKTVCPSTLEQKGPPASKHALAVHRHIQCIHKHRPTQRLSPQMLSKGDSEPHSFPDLAIHAAQNQEYRVCGPVKGLGLGNKARKPD